MIGQAIDRANSKAIDKAIGKRKGQL